VSDYKFFGIVSSQSVYASSKMTCFSRPY